MGPIGCAETSVRNYHYSLRNNTEESSSHVKCLCSYYWLSVKYCSFFFLHKYNTYREVVCWIIAVVM